MPSPSVSIHVLTYNGLATIGRCLESLLALRYDNFRITIIDNASADGSVDLVRSRFHSVEIIENDQNLGFGAGHNVGIRRALEKRSDFVWLINQDAWVAPDSLARLVEHATRTPDFGASSPVILNPDDSVWFAGGTIDRFRMRAIHQETFSGDKAIVPTLFQGHLKPDSPGSPVLAGENPASCAQSRRDDGLPWESGRHGSAVNPPYQTDYLSGCALFISRKALETAGLFDERFFLYYEDADLSLRIKEKGLSLSVIPSARVWHAETSNAARPEKTYHLVLSGLIFFRKHAFGVWRPWYAVFVPLRYLKNRLDILFRPNPVNRAVRKAYADFRRTNVKA